MKRNLAWFTPHRKTKESKQQKACEHPPPRRPPPTSSARYTTTSDLTPAAGPLPDADRVGFDRW